MAERRAEIDGKIYKIDVPDGMTDEEIQADLEQQLAEAEQKAPEQPRNNGFGTDVKNFVKSTAYSVPLGFGDEIKDATAALVAGGLSDNLTVGEAYKQAREETHQEQAQMHRDSPVASVAGDIAGSVLTGAGAIGTKAGTSLANSLRTGNAGSRIVKGAAAGAVSGAGYGAGSAEEGNRLSGAAEGAVAGGLIGGAVPALGSAASGIKSTVVPKIEKSSADLAQRAKDLGIPLRLDQISPTKVRDTVQKVSQQVPFSGVDNFEAQQKQAFNSAVAKTIGETSDSLGPETINKFLKRSDGTFDRLVRGNVIAVDPQDISNIGALKNTVNSTLGITSRDSKILKNEIDAVVKQLGGGQVKGELVASIRSDLLKKSTSASVGREVFSDLLEHVDDITKKSLTPDAVKELAQARREWRNFKTLEPLLEGATDGMINPTDLMNKVKSSKYIKAARSKVGDDELVDLARIGKKFLVKKGGSDTAQKSAVLLGTGGAGVGLVTNPLATLAAMAAAGGGMAANRGLQAINTSQKLVDRSIKGSRGAASQIKKRAANPLIAGGFGSAVTNKKP